MRLFSESKEESINKGFFIDSLNLSIIDTCGLNINPISLWGEKAWKIENHLLSIKKTKLWFSNYFLKFDNNSPSIQIKYKSITEQKWRPSSKFIEPDLGFYLQIEDKPQNDTIFVSVKIPPDSCAYYFIHLKNI